MNDLQRQAGQYLKDLADGVVPRKPRCGICHHFYEKFPVKISIKRHYADWYAYTGDEQFPVPDPEGSKPDLAYFDANDKWSGPYGEMRKQLCRFLGRRLLGEE